jgi:hypothetical protein
MMCETASINTGDMRTALPASKLPAIGFPQSTIGGKRFLVFD